MALFLCGSWILFSWHFKLGWIDYCWTDLLLDISIFAFFLTLYIVVGGFSRLLKGLVIPFSSGHHELNSTGIRERLCLTNTKQPNDRHAFAFLATYSFLVCICLSFITILVSYNFMKITLITSMYLHSGSMAQSDLLTTVIFLIIGHSVFLIFASLQHYSAFEMKQLNMT